MTSQTPTPPTPQNPMPWLETGFFEAIWKHIKTFKLLLGAPEVGCLWKASYLLITPAAVLIYVIFPDFVPGPVDDLLVSWWLIPLTISYLWRAMLPDWIVAKYHNIVLMDEMPPNQRPQPQAEATDEDEIEGEIVEPTGDEPVIIIGQPGLPAGDDVIYVPPTN